MAVNRLFRGKRIDNGEWIYGDKIIEPYHVAIQYYEDGKRVKATVIPETVGQYIHQISYEQDKIFEGDFVRELSSDEYGRIVFDEEDSMFIILYEDYIVNFGTVRGTDYEIIGNEYDNPELLF